MMAGIRPRVISTTKSLLIIAFMVFHCGLLPQKILFAQGETKDHRYYVRQAMQAYKEKKHAAYLENLQKAISLRPDHPTIMYNLAGAHALVGNSHDALAWLTKVAEMGLVYPAAADSDFVSIRDTEEFHTLLEKFEANKAPVNRSSTAFIIEEMGLITEGIAYDPQQETFYVSSVHKRKIISIDRKGTAKDFSSEQDGLWSAMGMKVDPRRRVLWVSIAATPQMTGFKPEEKGRSAVFKYALEKGKLIKKYLLADTSKAHWLGDLTLNARGDVFTTDSRSPAIYVINHQTDALELFVEDGSFASLQGMDWSEDGKYLFVADYSKGIFKIDGKTKAVSKLAHPGNVTLLGIDGLYFHRAGLIAIQNGVNPHRVLRLVLNKEWNRIERAEVMEANHVLFDEPTLGVIVQDMFYYIANSQWGSVDDKGALAPLDKLRPPVVLKIAL